MYASDKPLWTIGSLPGVTAYDLTVWRRRHLLEPATPACATSRGPWEDPIRHAALHDRAAAAARPFDGKLLPDLAERIRTRVDAGTPTFVLLPPRDRFIAELRNALPGYAIDAVSDADASIVAFRVVRSMTP